MKTPVRDKVMLVLATREGGATERCHGTPHHGSYSVGLHSYNAVSLLLRLHPGPSIELVKALMWHDVVERWTGDVPAPAKWAHEGLRNALTELEETLERHWDIKQPLTKTEGLWLHWCDLMEFYMWTEEQLALGNRNVSSAQGRVLERLDAFRDEWPEPCRQFMKDYRWERLSD